MKATKNYGFKKPEDDDFYDVKNFTDAMDQVDAVLHQIETAGNIYIGGANLSAEATGTDSNAEFKVLAKTSSSVSDVKIFGKAIPIKLGTFAVMIRAKVSDTSKTDKLIRVRARKNTESGEIVKEFNISPNMFDVNGKYKLMGTIVDFNNAAKGTMLYLEAAIVKTTAVETVTIDYVLINPAYTAISAM